MDLVSTPLLPPGFKVPASRNESPSRRLRGMLASKPYVFAPGVYDPMGAQLVMYHGFDAVYFSGYSFAIGHLGTTDMDLYSSVEIADGARRSVSALRKFQLTMAMGDPDKKVPPTHLEIPPVVVDMDAGYGNLFNVQRTVELYLNAGVAAAHLEDQVMPKRCGHIAGKALIAADEFVGKLKMMRSVADDLGRAGPAGHRLHLHHARPAARCRPWHVGPPRRPEARQRRGLHGFAAKGVGGWRHDPDEVAPPLHRGSVSPPRRAGVRRVAL